MPDRGVSPTYTHYSGQKNPAYTHYSGQNSPAYSESPLSGSTTFLGNTIVLRGVVIVGRTTTYMDDK